MLNSVSDFSEQDADMNVPRSHQVVKMQIPWQSTSFLLGKYCINIRDSESNIFNLEHAFTSGKGPNITIYGYTVLWPLYLHIDRMTCGTLSTKSCHHMTCFILGWYCIDIRDSESNIQCSRSVRDWIAIFRCTVRWPLYICTWM